MNKKTQPIAKKGSVDYDNEEDILFFKVNNKEYDHSIELDGIFIDLDKEGSISGLQIFEAATVLHIEKERLKDIKNWMLHINTEHNTIKIELFFSIQEKERCIERGQQIIRDISEELQNTEMICAMSAA